MHFNLTAMLLAVVTPQIVASTLSSQDIGSQVTSANTHTALIAQSPLTKGTAKSEDDQDNYVDTQTSTAAHEPAKRPFELVSLTSGNLKLYGALWKPQGAGPFPAIIYNHGSEQRNALVAGPDKGYGNIGKFYASKGFVCLLPLRRGHTFGFNKEAIATSQSTLSAKISIGNRALTVRTVS
jgi:hypothetical protein